MYTFIHNLKLNRCLQITVLLSLIPLRVSFLRIIVSGKKSGKSTTHIFEMIDFYDSEKGYTSMGKATSFPASIAAQMIASGRITKRGSLFPEEIFQAELYHPFMDALRKWGVLITHKVIFDE